MRKFLFITPFYPPLQRVAAIVPLKITRHLPAHGWTPVVLADMWPGAPLDPSLAELVPQDIVVDRHYSGRAAKAAKEAHAPGNAPPRRPPSALARGIAALDSWLARRDYLPLGTYGFFHRHALARARALLKDHACDLIVAHSSPVASLLTGAALARETGKPFVVLLDDPWRPCEVRNAVRPPHTRIANAFHESRVIAAAERVLLFTDRSRDDYRRLYPKKAPETFVSFHHGADRDLQTQEWSGEMPSPSILFFGTFGGVVQATPAIRLLAHLATRSGRGATVKLVSTDRLPEADQRLAERLGVADRVVVTGRLPYRAAQAVMAKASILLEINATAQRIVAKTYDYLASERPILSIGPDHPQLDEMLERTGAGRSFRPEALDAMADFVEQCLAQGERPVFARARPAIDDYGFAQSAKVIAGAFDDAIQAARP